MCEKNGVVRLGFIGTGGFVTGNHLPNAGLNPKLEIRALCDLRDDVLRELGAVYHPAYITTDMKRVCEDPDIDAVVIGTRETVRVDPIRTAAEGGKHILVEKPMSVGPEDTREIVDIINRTGVFLQVGFNRPYSKPLRDVRENFQRIRGPEALIHYRIVGEDRLWPQALQAAIKNHERSTIIHEVVHIFDLLNWLTEDYPTHIFVAGGRSDNHVLVLEYPGNTVASIMSGSCGTEAFPKERLEIFTNNTTIIMDSFVEVVSAGAHDFGDEYYPLESDPLAAEVPGEGIEPLRRKRRRWHSSIPPEDLARGYYYTSRPSEDKGHYSELECFRQSVAGSRAPETDHVRGAVATLTGLAAIESLRERRSLELHFDDLLS